MSNFDMDLEKTCQIHDRFDENQRICILGEYLLKISPAAQFYCQKRISIGLMFEKNRVGRPEYFGGQIFKSYKNGSKSW